MMTDEIESASVGAEVEVTKSAPRGRPPRVVSPQKTTVRIIIEENDDIPPTGLYLGHNGRGYLLQPGQAIDATPELLEILDHAVMSSPQLDPGTKQVVGYRDRLRYPYRRVQDGS